MNKIWSPRTYVSISVKVIRFNCLIFCFQPRIYLLLVDILIMALKSI